MNGKLLVIISGLLLTCLTGHAQEKRTVSGGHMNAVAPASGISGPSQPALTGQEWLLKQEEALPWAGDPKFTKLKQDRTALVNAAARNRRERAKIEIAIQEHTATADQVTTAATLDQYYANQTKAMTTYRDRMTAMANIYTLRAVRDGAAPNGKEIVNINRSLEWELREMFKL
jgi:hypothetical protein